MKPHDKAQLKKTIVEEIEAQEGLIESLADSVKPVAPDNAIGRLTRMEAIGSRAVSEASMNSARQKLARLKAALEKCEDPDFGLCRLCDRPIPEGRLLLMPESTVCVACAEAK